MPQSTEMSTRSEPNCLTCLDVELADVDQRRSLLEVEVVVDHEVHCNVCLLDDVLLEVHEVLVLPEL